MLECQFDRSIGWKKAFQYEHESGSWKGRLSWGWWLHFTVFSSHACTMMARRGSMQGGSRTDGYRLVTAPRLLCANSFRTSVDVHRPILLSPNLSCPDKYRSKSPPIPHLLISTLTKRYFDAKLSPSPSVTDESTYDARKCSTDRERAATTAES